MPSNTLCLPSENMRKFKLAPIDRHETLPSALNTTLLLLYSVRAAKCHAFDVSSRVGFLVLRMMGCASSSTKHHTHTHVLVLAETTLENNTALFERVCGRFGGGAFDFDGNDVGWRLEL